MAYVNLIDLIYPVGSIYYSMNNTHPATLFGGEWTKITCFPYPQDSNTASGLTGGQAVHQHVAELRYRIYYGSIISGSATDGEQLWARDYATTETNNSYTGGAVSAPGHWSVKNQNISSFRNNGLQTGYTTVNDASGSYLKVPTTYQPTLPPYITCYAWYRTK